MASAVLLPQVPAAIDQVAPRDACSQPQGTYLAGPMAWHGSQFADESSFVFELSTTDIVEVDVAVAAFEGT